MNNRRLYRDQDTGQFKKRIERELGVEARKHLDSGYASLDKLAEQSRDASEEQKRNLRQKADRVIEETLRNIGISNGRVALFHAKLDVHYRRKLIEASEK
jgi:hypothetical protein